MPKVFATTYSQLLRLLFFIAVSATWNSDATAVTLKIMPLGDSITYGIGAGGGYRLPLYNLLTNANCDFRFVGSLSANSAPRLPSTQVNHEGHVAYTIQNCTTTADGESRTGLLENVETWIKTTTPDIILLMIGTNDINANYDRANAPTRLGNLLTTISGLQPKARLIVAQITPIGNGPYSTTATDSLAQTYNAGIATVVAQHRAAGELVSMVDMHSILNIETDLSDGLHPNQTGYNKMAQAWYDGIQAATVPEPGTIIPLATGLLLLLGYTRHRRKSTGVA